MFFIWLELVAIAGNGTLTVVLVVVYATEPGDHTT